MQAEIVVLRLVHILGGIFWVGSGLFTSLFLMPTLARSGPVAAQVMAGLQRRRLFTALPVAAVLTILSGLRLMWILSAGFSREYFATSVGHTLASAGGAAIVAFIFALTVVRPAAMRAGRLAESLANASLSEGERQRIGAEMGRLGRRSAVASAIVVALLVLAAAGMAVARYL